MASRTLHADADVDAGTCARHLAPAGPLAPRPYALLSAFCGLALGGLGACAPTLDWREFRPEGTSLAMMFPCKPDGHARLVPLAGAQVRLSLHACQAGEGTWALAWADLRDPRGVPLALRELQASSQANVSASAASPRPLRLPGATPQPDSGRWSLSGRAPDGRALRGEVAVFSRGTVVFQATHLSFSATPDLAEAVETFFTSLRLGP